MAGAGADTGSGGTGRGRAALALTLLALLAACAEGQPPAAGGGGASRVTELVETDVEAPETFQVTEAGLWDGRPSLGGVWVAHPDVTDPERVIIRNQDTGGFVIGALFRRERDNPGPALQVSSDAAEALGMLAGAPATLNVTALRREEAAEPAPTAAAAPVGVPTEAPAGAVEALAPAGAVETATLDAAPIATETPTTAMPVDPAAVDAVSRATSAILASNAAAPAAAPAQAAPASGLDSPFVQLAMFSIEANAEETARAMEAAGLPARAVASTTQGAAFWRVLVGPATTAAEQDDLLARVRGQGFADAYLVRN